jgi:glutamate racemase
LPNIEVINKACPMLATVAEEGRAKSEEGRKAIKEYMQIFKERQVTDIVLGCTHYPIYEQMIRDELGYEVNLINTGMAVAKYLKNLFEEEKNEAMSRDEKIFLTKPSQDFKKIAETMLGEEIEIFPIK